MRRIIVIVMATLLIFPRICLADEDTDNIINSFKAYMNSYFMQYDTDTRENVTLLEGGWVKRKYEPVKDSLNFDIEKTSSLTSPYIAISEFTLKIRFSAFYKTKAEAMTDNNFIEQVTRNHRHKYSYKNNRWVPIERQHLSQVLGKWYDCDEIISFGPNAGKTDINGCWEK